MKYTVKNGYITVTDDNGQKWMAQYPYNEGEEVQFEKVVPSLYSAEFICKSKDFIDLNDALKVTLRQCENVSATVRFTLTDGTEAAALRVAERTFIMLDCIGISAMDNDGDFRGAYEESELRWKLQGEYLNLFPPELRDRMAPWENGDLLRLPKAEEIFSPQELRDADISHDASVEQWSVMKDRRNRIAEWSNIFQWYWCKNKCSASCFVGCTSNGYANRVGAANVRGVRPVFRLSSV